MTGDTFPGLPGLPGLPGSDHPGTGPLVEPLLDDLLTATAPGVPDALAAFRVDPARTEEEGPAPLPPAPDVVAALAAHRDRKRGWYGDVLGPLRVPASATASLLAGLTREDDAEAIVLIPDPSSDDPLTDLRAARSLLLDNHRVELVGVELPFVFAPIDPGQPGLVVQAARLALDELDFTVPAWFMVPGVPGWEPAFDVLAQDGAESVALFLPPPVTPDLLAGAGAIVRALIDRELPFAVVGGLTGLVTSGEGYGLLNLLGAVRAALNGVDGPDLTAILAERDLGPLAAAARRMSEADAAIARAFLPTVNCPSIPALVEELVATGLITREN
jgi:hypothetical protein